MRRRRAVSSVGRAPARQAGGHWFEPSTAHCEKARKCGLFVSLARPQIAAQCLNGASRRAAGRALRRARARIEDVKGAQPQNIRRHQGTGSRELPSLRAPAALRLYGRRGMLCCRRPKKQDVRLPRMPRGRARPALAELRGVRLARRVLRDPQPRARRLVRNRCVCSLPIREQLLPTGEFEREDARAAEFRLTGRRCRA